MAVEKKKKKTQSISLKKMPLKMSSARCRSFVSASKCKVLRLNTFINTKFVNKFLVLMNIAQYVFFTKGVDHIIF